MGLPATALADRHDIEVWPENVHAVRLFDAMLTQWRMGSIGPIGLDYAALPVVRQACRLRCTRDDFRGLQIMEAEALRWFASQRK